MNVFKCDLDLRLRLLFLSRAPSFWTRRPVKKLRSLNKIITLGDAYQQRWCDAITRGVAKPGGRGLCSILRSDKHAES